MTGYDVYRHASALLGYDDRCEMMANEILIWINQILSDLNLSEILSPSDEIIVSAKHKQALILGVAMMAAVSNADIAKIREMKERYHQKRAAALSEFDQISDALPSAKGE